MRNKDGKIIIINKLGINAKLYSGHVLEIVTDSRKILMNKIRFFMKQKKILFCDSTRFLNVFFYFLLLKERMRKKKKNDQNSIGIF